jgi:hypothetical protein
MAAPKGHEKWGGRKPGSKNKRSSILEICQSIGLDPFLEMAKIAQQPHNIHRFDALKELCQYIEPKKRQTDVSLDPEKNSIKIQIYDYGQKTGE